MEGADEPLRLAVIAQRLPRRLDAARERRIRDHLAVPDFFQDLVPRYQAVAVLDEQGEQRKNLGLQRAHGALRP